MRARHSYFAALLLVATTTTALPSPRPEGDPHQYLDSYSNIPVPDQTDDLPQDSPLSLDLLPPSVLASAAPHLFYMGSDGVAVPAEGENYNYRRVLRKRDVVSASPKPVDEDDRIDPEMMVTDETFFGCPCATGRRLGYRPAKAYYARRYHKYPWNYH